MKGIQGNVFSQNSQNILNEVPQYLQANVLGAPIQNKTLQTISSEYMIDRNFIANHDQNHRYSSKLITNHNNKSTNYLSSENQLNSFNDINKTNFEQNSIQESKNIDRISKLVGETFEDINERENQDGILFPKINAKPDQKLTQSIKNINSTQRENLMLILDNNVKHQEIKNYVGGSSNSKQWFLQQSKNGEYISNFSSGVENEEVQTFQLTERDSHDHNSTYDEQGQEEETQMSTNYKPSSLSYKRGRKIVPTIRSNTETDDLDSPATIKSQQSVFENSFQSSRDKSNDILPTFDGSDKILPMIEPDRKQSQFRIKKNQNDGKTIKQSKFSEKNKSFEQEKIHQMLDNDIKFGNQMENDQDRVIQSYEPSNISNQSTKRYSRMRRYIYRTSNDMNTSLSNNSGNQSYEPEVKSSTLLSFLPTNTQVEQKKMNDIIQEMARQDLISPPHPTRKQSNDLKKVWQIENEEKQFERGQFKSKSLPPSILNKSQDNQKQQTQVRKEDQKKVLFKQTLVIFNIEKNSKEKGKIRDHHSLKTQLKSVKAMWENIK